MQLTDLLVKSKAGDFSASLALSDLAANLTPATAQNQQHAQLSVLRKHDLASYLKTISLLIIRLNKQFNVARPMNTEQITDLTARIGKKFYYLRLPEILYCFEQAVSGRYGPAYQSLDSETVMTWIEKYDVEERTPVVVANADKKTPVFAKRLNDDQLAAFYDRVADGQKTEIQEEKRISDEFRTAQNEARARYIQEKNAGIVKDYQNTTPDAE